MEKLKTDVVTPTFRVSYPSVFKPSLNKLSGKMEFGLEALFPLGTDFSIMKQMAQNACVNEFGADQNKWPKNLRNPFRDQKEKAKEGVLADGLVAGAIFMRFKKSADKGMPGIVDQSGKNPIQEESEFYAGCFAKAHVNAYAYNKGGNCGVSFGLNHLQFVKDGDRFSGAPRVEESFAPVENSATDASGIFN